MNIPETPLPVWDELAGEDLRERALEHGAESFTDMSFGGAETMLDLLAREEEAKKSGRPATAAPLTVQGTRGTFRGRGGIGGKPKIERRPAPVSEHGSDIGGASAQIPSTDVMHLLLDLKQVISRQSTQITSLVNLAQTQAKRLEAVESKIITEIGALATQITRLEVTNKALEREISRLSNTALTSTRVEGLTRPSTTPSFGDVSEEPVSDFAGPSSAIQSPVTETAPTARPEEKPKSFADYYAGLYD